MAYFDPAAAAYREAVASLNAHLTVTPAASVAAGSQSASGTARKGVRNPALWALAAAPVLALAGYVAVRKKRPAATSIAATAEGPVQASAFADGALRQARACAGSGDANGCLAALGHACWGYLSRKLDIPPSALSRGTAVEALQARGASPETAARAARLMDDLHLARYAPSAIAGGIGGLDATCAEAAALIQSLEAELRGV